jgi:nucleoside-diphosphate-sugar epimerase
MHDAITTASTSARVALVTGATGFVGSHLVPRLVRAGWQVHVVSRVNSRVPDAPEFFQVKMHTHDGTTEGMIRLIGDAKPVVVFHLASLFLSQHEASDVERLVVSNVLFGNQLLEAMKTHGVSHLINTGTSWQHYENKAYSPVNLYAATKQAFESLLQYYVEAHGLRAITLKLSDTYGPHDPRPEHAALGHESRRAVDRSGACGRRGASVLKRGRALVGWRSAGLRKLCRVIRPAHTTARYGAAGGGGVGAITPH